MQNKRGQGLSTNAIILIILGIVVLAMVSIGFMMGWGKLAPWLKPSNNVDDIRQACELSCSLGKSYDYCFVKRELVTEGETLEDATCYFLQEKRSKYKIEQCSGITCDVSESEEMAKTECENKSPGEIIDYFGDKGILQYTCPEPSAP